MRKIVVRQCRVYWGREAQESGVVDDDGGGDDGRNDCKIRCENNIHLFRILIIV